MRRSWIAAAFLLTILVLFRLSGAAFGEALPNFSPLPAVFVCSLVFFRGTLAWLLPTCAWLISNPFASLIQGSNPLANFGAEVTAIVALVAIGGLVVCLRKKLSSSTGSLLLAGVGAAVLFQVATGVVAWITYPLYEKTAAGLFASLWTGPVNATLPSWVFLRNLAAANLLFTSIWLVAQTTPALTMRPQTTRFSFR